MPRAFWTVEFRLVFVERGDPDRVDLVQEGAHLDLPFPVEVVPMLVVMAGAGLEIGQPLLDPLGVGDRIGGDIDAAVDDAVVDA